MHAPSGSRRKVDGMVLIDKPTGCTSNHVLQRVKRVVRALKAGHAGTLDPLATGLLPVLLGDATRFAGYVSDADKQYIATIRLGVQTDSGDVTGKILAQRAVPMGEGTILRALQGFVGTISQVPPMFSALRVNGNRLYALARKGEAVSREARSITIHRIDTMALRLPDVTVRIDCSKGTYIRSIAEDLGAALGCGATLAALRRTRVGQLDVSSAILPCGLEALTDGEVLGRLLPIDSAVISLPAIWLSGSEARRFRFGQTLPLNSASHGVVRVYDLLERRFLGLGTASNESLKPQRLLGP